MTSRLAFVLAIACLGIGVAVWHPPSTAVASDGVAPVVGTLMTTVAAADDESGYAYVGSKKCKKCHIAQHKSWAVTQMGQAFDTLKPGQAKESKEKFNLDVSKDYTQDAKCLKCHTVGFGKAGGYVIPNPDDKKSVRRAKNLESVGCESCHGPGSEYVKVFKEIMDTKRKYKVEELRAVGLREVNEAVCKTCHNPDSPTINEGDAFDYEKRKAEGTHEHRPLEQREE